MLALLMLAQPAAAGTEFGGYFRVMTRPDFEGGGGRLGYWNLYGRLLNEGPWAALELRQDVLERKAGSDEIWTDLHAKVEGGSVAGADTGNGSLANLRLTQLYAEAGNVGLRNVTWRIGTLESTFGDLGLYDSRPTQILVDTLGGQAQLETDHLSVIVGLGDAGYLLKGAAYDTVISAGGSAKLRLGDHLELGVGGQYYYEPKVVGNRFAPHATPGVTYEQYLRGEAVKDWLDDHPNQGADFPAPVPSDARSWKAVAYLGFGDLGPLKWNNLYANMLLHHPLGYVTETVDGQDYDVYVKGLTDERREINLGDEADLTLIPDRLDIAIAGMYGNYTDGDNDIAPSDADRTFYSGVVRAQVYLSPHVHLLAESSLAREISHNGNAYRDHKDSVFTSTDGISDTEGLEYGDSDTRDTWQGKAGIVLSPLGAGIYTRPQLRLMYGIQHSTQNNAFGNSFVETLDQYNHFGNVERHWHSVVALETEAWF
jgi:hypothetical protein